MPFYSEFIPSVLQEDGYILYFCLKRKYIEEGTFSEGYVCTLLCTVTGLTISSRGLDNKSWMSINRWPCSTVPKWSPRIPICSTDPAVHEYLWKVELFSIAFSPHDRRSDSEPDFVFKFPKGPIHVVFDTGMFSVGVMI